MPRGRKGPVGLGSMVHLQSFGESQPGVRAGLPHPVIPEAAFLTPALASSSDTALFRGGPTPYELKSSLLPTSHDVTCLTPTPLGSSFHHHNSQPALVPFWFALLPGHCHHIGPRLPSASSSPESHSTCTSRGGIDWMEIIIIFFSHDLIFFYPIQKM